MKNERGILISSILTMLEQGVRRKNRLYVAHGGQHSEQQAFDRVDTFFQLAFLTDADLCKVAGSCGL